MNDKVFLALLATLMLAVFILERRRRDIPKHVLPPPAGEWNLRDTNVPACRDGSVVVDDVAYMDVTDAAISGAE